MAGRTTTKRAILQAAVDLAAEKGITGTTMDDVALRAGVAKGSLYYNFSSKDKLFEGLLRAGLEDLTEALRSARQGRAGWDAVEALVSALLERIAGNAPLAKVIAGEIFRTDRPWQDTTSAIRQLALAEFAAAIAQTRGDAADAGLTALMASSVFGATLLAGLEWLVYQPQRSQPDVVAAILSTFSGQLKG